MVSSSISILLMIGINSLSAASPLFKATVVPGLSIANFLLWTLTTPVQFVLGKKFYVNAYKALRHGAANMDVLVALGTSCAYFYSVGMIIGSMLDAQNQKLTVVGPNMMAHSEDMDMSDQETYFDTSAMLITFILLGKYFEVVAKGKTSEAIRELMSLQVCQTFSRILIDECHL